MAAEMQRHADRSAKGRDAPRVRKPRDKETLTLTIDDVKVRIGRKGQNWPKVHGFLKYGE